MVLVVLLTAFQMDLLDGWGLRSILAQSDELLNFVRIARFSIYLSWKEEHGNAHYHHLMVVVVLLTI